ncbi:MAG: hypothetical protein ACOC1K_03825 [Nanoarchaeota archaeon]
MIKVSFDYDGTLEMTPIKEYAKELVERGNVEVWIVTSRFSNDELYKKFFSTTTNVNLTNNDLWDDAKYVGIPKERIHFTNMTDKFHFFKENNFLWHIDDDWVENRQILRESKTKAISSFNSPNWKHKCEKILKSKLKEKGIS